MDITTDTIEKIIELARPEIVTINGREYATSHLIDPRDFRAREEPTLEVTTLSGAAAVIAYHFEVETQERALVHVASPSLVVAWGQRRADESRAMIVRASAELPYCPFDKWTPEDDVARWLRAYCTTDVDLAKLLKRTSKAGTATDPVDVTLAVHRSFPEIDPIPEPFTLEDDLFAKGASGAGTEVLLSPVYSPKTEVKLRCAVAETLERFLGEYDVRDFVTVVA